jgi:PTH1 family peptidyl-tRNA hydrolase
MNLSGPALSRVLKSSNVPPSRLLVLHDSLAQASLAISPKAGGSANGHNGVRSIIAALGTDGFRRLRLGIGRTDADAATYVLGPLSVPERAHWGEGGRGVDDAWKAIEKIVPQLSS